jgi:hypothetical protein
MLFTQAVNLPDESGQDKFSYRLKRLEIRVKISKIQPLFLPNAQENNKKMFLI